MTSTRIYLLDEINQNDIDSTHVFPAEDNLGVDTVQITLAQLAQYLFNGASTNDDTTPLNEFPLVIGNESFAIGNTSMAIGANNDASNDGDPSNYNSAVGYQNTTYGNWGASAFGYKNHADYSQSSAFGHKNAANNRLASAFGTDNLASGEASSAFGRNNTASDYGSIAAGYANTASGEYATAVGANNYVYSYNAQAFGCYNTISSYDIPGNWCTTVGAKNTIFSPDSFFENDDYNGKSTACGYNNFVAGCYNTAVGANNSAATMGFVIKCSSVGYGNTASGYWGASAFGYRNYANDIQCSAFGHKNTANDSGASAFGNNNTASGESSIACGYSNTASNGYCSAFGAYNTASDYNASAMGCANTASGQNSTACGYYNTANGDNSVAIGYQCYAQWDNSCAMGYKAAARWPGTTNIGGAIVVRGDNNENFNASDAFASYAGVQNVIMSPNIDFTITTYSIITVLQYSNGSGYTVGDTLTVTGGNGDAILTVASVDGGGMPTGYTITNPGTGYATGTNIAMTIISSTGDGNATVDIWVQEPIELDVPMNCTFYTDEVGVILNTHLDNLSVQPHVSFGWVGTPAGFLAATLTTNLLNIRSREVFSSLLTYDGKQTLLASITTKATADYMSGRFYFKGMLVENTPIGS